MAGYFNPYVQMIDQAKAAPLAGAASGFATGGAVGAIIGGISGLASRHQGFKAADDAVMGVNTNPDMVDEDAYGRPTFNSAAAIEATQNRDSLISASKRSRRGLRRLFAGPDDHILSHRMSMQATNIDRGIQSQRDMFNSRMVDFNNQQAAMTQYNQLLNNQNRLNNLYNIGTSLY